MKRTTTDNRMRGRKLQAFRERYLRAHPLCERCSKPGRPVVATEVDHRIALVNGGKDFDADPSQAQALCTACHKTKTAEDLGHKPQRRIGADGWPVE